MSPNFSTYCVCIEVADFIWLLFQKEVSSLPGTQTYTAVVRGLTDTILHNPHRESLVFVDILVYPVQNNYQGTISMTSKMENHKCDLASVNCPMSMYFIL